MRIASKRIFLWITSMETKSSVRLSHPWEEASYYDVNLIALVSCKAR